MSSSAGIRGWRLADAAKPVGAWWRHVGGTSADALAVTGLAAVRNASSLAEPVIYEVSCIGEWGALFGLGPAISTAAGNTAVGQQKGDKEYGTFQ
jgi:hypothetical protein